MKVLVNSLCLLAVIVIPLSVCKASTPDQEKAFLDQYKAAFEAMDAAKLESFLYTKNADPEALEFYKMMMMPEQGSRIANIELRKLTTDEEKKAAEVMEGPTGKAKLPLMPTKKLVLNVESKSPNGSSTSKSESFIAEVDGKLVIPVPVPVK